MSDNSINHTTTRDQIAVTNPATGEVIGHVPKGTEDDVEAAFAKARRAQTQWATTSLRHRRRILLKFHNLVLDHREDLMDQIQDENGKNRLSALEEVLDVALTSRYYAYRGPGYVKGKRRKAPMPLITATWEQRPPKGWWV
ncbi:aldehyde dehydrogenase family protein [Corynebacterium aquatimens]|uniref:aldehyde dehydrogenase family protein n=1 Tax=Corynebacterium aquatimens TaxID=1190508 RepID=UPI003313D069